MNEPQKSDEKKSYAFFNWQSIVLYIIGLLSLLMILLIENEFLKGAVIFAIFTLTTLLIRDFYIRQPTKADNQPKNPYYKKLYDFFNWLSLLMFIIGILTFAYIFVLEGELYKGLAILIIFTWSTIFIRYFSWAIYFYNINYGWTDRDWTNYFKAVKRKKDGEYVLKEELNAPKFNLYRSQSFGLPTGTVRGMIALTLLFGALSMLIASFGKDGNIASDSFFWDHFEFFKTAFLMMIAFYFGDKSLKYLQNRSNAAREKNYLDSKKSNNAPAPISDLDQDDADFRSEMGEAADESSSTGQSLVIPSSFTDMKKAIAQSEEKPNPTGLIPIIDAGHGGIDPKTKKYTTAPSKMYEFLDDKGNPDKRFLDPKGNPTNAIYEGVVNRSIATMLIELLEENGIKYYEQTVSSVADISLKDRVAFANDTYRSNRNVYFLSIHSNASGIVPSPGVGSARARGLEVFTSVGQSKSDDLADIAAKWYKKEFPDFRFRQDMTDGDDVKEENFYVLRKTACPAFLVENLFFDNSNEADFLMSEAGQMRIATCLFKIVKEIYETQNNGILA